MINLKKYSLLLTFVGLVGSISIIDMIKPHKSFSELENRVLSKAPTFQFKTFLSGEFNPKFEKYINDQFLFRDTWIDLKSKAEFTLGKIENNGIIYGKDHYMFEKFDDVNEEILSKNIDCVKQFIEKYTLPTTFALIPNSYMVLSDKLPTGTSLINQYAYIDTIYESLSNFSINTLDLSGILHAHASDYIYYRTDHHWTTYGAYLAYTDFISSLALDPVALETLTALDVPDFYGTYFSKTKLFNAVSDTITYYPLDVSLTIDGISYDSLYDDSKWVERDKYGAFLWGNNGVTVIKSTHNQNTSSNHTSKILVFKDSYANAFVPFLSYNFDEIHVLDLRSLPIKVSDYLKEHDFDEVLILYSFKNFSEDTNITKIKN